jgi:hypothetical protein
LKGSRLGRWNGILRIKNGADLDVDQPSLYN